MVMPVNWSTPIPKEGIDEAKTATAKSQPPYFHSSEHSQAGVKRKRNVASKTVKTVRIVSPSVRANMSRRETEKEVISWVLNEERITSAAQAIYLIRFKVARYERVFGKASEAILKEIVTPALVRENRINLEKIPESLITEDIALAAIAHRYTNYVWTPDSLKTHSFFYRCLKVNPSVMQYAPQEEQGHLNYPDLIRHNWLLYPYIPKAYITPELEKLAVCISPKAIDFIDPHSPNYEALCMVALQQDGRVLECIDQDCITEAMVEQAVRTTPCAAFIHIPAHLINARQCIQVIQAGNVRYLLRNLQSYKEVRIRFKQLVADNAGLLRELINVHQEIPRFLKWIPERERTENLCKKHLACYPAEIDGVPEELLIQHEDWCRAAVICVAEVMADIPKSFQNTHFYASVFHLNADISRHLPDTFFKENPQYLYRAIDAENDLNDIPEQYRTEKLCAHAIEKNPYLIGRVPDKHLHAMPLSAQLAYGKLHKLPESVKSRLIKTGDSFTENPYRPVFQAGELLNPQNPLNVNERSTLLDKLGSQLAACPPFKLPNETLGRDLQDFLYDRISLNKASLEHIPLQTSQLQNSQLQIADSFSGDPQRWEAYGGRTFLCDESYCCRRMKFLRQGESLDDFFREEAVHCFCHANSSRLPLNSEVPRPVGFKLLPVDKLPDVMKKQCRSELAVLTRQGRHYYLIYEFETNNRDYSQLAHQKDKDQCCDKAERGILKACHDLGVWSGCGAVYTSTIQAYHNFSTARRELFLSPLLAKRTFPGALSFWDTAAIDQSDWGWTGLRDLGDMESDTRIDTYGAASDSRFCLPGYFQRVSFLNAFVENMVAAMLHYARLHKSDAEYHYKNEDCVIKVAQFVEVAINEHINGLLGSQATLKGFFDSHFPDDASVYQNWLKQAARETIYWTAPQKIGTDCYAHHLNQEGKFPQEIYPDSPTSYSDYPGDFAKNGKHHLGQAGSAFPLNTFIRGLAFAASNIAIALQPDEPMDQS